jgi:hypothetical protein
MPFATSDGGETLVYAFQVPSVHGSVVRAVSGRATTFSVSQLQSVYISSYVVTRRGAGPVGIRQPSPSAVIRPVTAIGPTSRRLRNDLDIGEPVRDHQGSRLRDQL